MSTWRMEHRELLQIRWNITTREGQSKAEYGESAQERRTERYEFHVNQRYEDVENMQW